MRLDDMNFVGELILRLVLCIAGVFAVAAGCMLVLYVAAKAVLP